jgi:hypothetical protein
MGCLTAGVCASPLPLLITPDEAASLLRTTRRAIYIMVDAPVLVEEPERGL